jgi:hypothetical protein
LTAELLLTLVSEHLAAITLKGDTTPSFEGLSARRVKRVNEGADS